VSNTGCNGFSFGVHCVEEGDRIPPLQSYGQALKQKDCFSDVLSWVHLPIFWTIVRWSCHPICLLSVV